MGSIGSEERWWLRPRLTQPASEACSLLEIDEVGACFVVVKIMDMVAFFV